MIPHFLSIYLNVPLSFTWLLHFFIEIVNISSKSLSVQNIKLPTRCYTTFRMLFAPLPQKILDPLILRIRNFIAKRGNNQNNQCKSILEKRCPHPHFQFRRNSTPVCFVHFLPTPSISYIQTLCFTSNFLKYFCVELPLQIFSLCWYKVAQCFVPVYIYISNQRYRPHHKTLDLMFLKSFLSGTLKI